MSSTILGSAEENSPIYFWREYDEPYGFLSQWYDCAFHHEGITYQSAEMWMMVQKAKLFSDEARRDAVFEIFLRHDTLGVSSSQVQRSL